MQRVPHTSSPTQPFGGDYAEVEIGHFGNRTATVREWIDQWAEATAGGRQ